LVQEPCSRWKTKTIKLEFDASQAALEYQ
jgi:hypothetical protein